MTSARFRPSLAAFGSRAHRARRVFFAALLCVACMAEAAPRSARPDVLYRDYCSVCHGERGDGRSRARGSLVPPPRDFTATRRADLPRAAMIAAVSDGKPGTAMVGWKTQLDRDEIESVVDYVRRTFMRGVPPGPEEEADMSLPLPMGLTGNTRRGASFYAANCSACHGPRGDGRGPRAYFIVPKPRNFIDAESRATYNRPALFAAIAAGKTGTVMPAWGNVVDDQQIADVAEYVFLRFIRGRAIGAPRESTGK
jgi:mono/diheme cytochrome c family protein